MKSRKETCLLKCGSLSSIASLSIYPDSLILQAIRKSLRGKSRDILLTLRESASPSIILNKLEGIYGNVSSNEVLLQRFYLESQLENESVSLQAKSPETSSPSIPSPQYNYTSQRGRCRSFQSGRGSQGRAGVFIIIKVVVDKEVVISIIEIVLINKPVTQPPLPILYSRTSLCCGAKRRIECSP